ncbi:DASH complex, subunit Dad2 [Nadsonia fulvescens var. elongata DSM 6958]|uniref:DASH complex subunit DAD2 n=1 Tax=Nadsonia fulvescens var. elongata DSM 6958 TaxID=857566 RepID=A0A1E3PPN4_9ASCO|nr:DASH complex, subunit Dad2 [Nadsonia fulvescens var. elongata DSM 6958]
MGSKGPNPALVRRVIEKRRELEACREMQDMTSDLVTVFQELEAKLDVLSDGTEAVALVMSNWHNVLRSISLASHGLKKYTEEDYENRDTPPLPEALVRIPIDEN